MDAQEVHTRLVVGVYRSAVKKTAGQMPYVRIGDGIIASSSFFWRLQKETGRTLTELMDRAIAFYSKDWCLRSFRRGYPPFSVATGTKNRKRLTKFFRKKMHETRESQIEKAKMVAETMLRAMTEKEALKLVNDGWPEDKTMRKLVREELNGT